MLIVHKRCCILFHVLLVIGVVKNGNNKTNKTTPASFPGLNVPIKYLNYFYVHTNLNCTKPQYAYILSCILYTITSRLVDNQVHYIYTHTYTSKYLLMFTFYLSRIQTKLNVFQHIIFLINASFVVSIL